MNHQINHSILWLAIYGLLLGPQSCPVNCKDHHFVTYIVATCYILLVVRKKIMEQAFKEPVTWNTTFIPLQITRVVVGTGLNGFNTFEQNPLYS